VNPSFRTRAIVACVPLLLMASCVVAPESSPRARFDLAALSQYNHRGVPEVDTGVVQGSSVVTLPTKDGGGLSIGAWGNVNVRDDTGDAWFPDGAAGDFSEVRFFGRYSRKFGEVDTTFALTNYTLTQGSEFVLGPAQGVRGATNEVSATVSRSELFAGITPRLEVHYDYDEVEDFYLRAGLARSFAINEKLTLDLDLHLGYSGADQAEWTIGVAESGLSDLGLDARLAYPLASNITLSLFMGASTLVDSAFRDWFEVLTDSDLPIDADNVWAGIGATWTY